MCIDVEIGTAWPKNKAKKKQAMENHVPRGLLCCEGVFATTPAPCWLAEGGAGWCFTTALNLHLETKRPH